MKIPRKVDYTDFDKAIKDIPEMFNYELEFYWHVINISLMTNEQKMKFLRVLEEEGIRRFNQ